MGPLFAILGALCFAVSATFTRRAVVRVSNSTAGAAISVFIGLPFFLIVLLAMGRLGAMGGFPWQGYAYLAVAGIIHFVIGRNAWYQAIQRLGANRSQVLLTFHPLLTVIGGWLVFNETLSWRVAAGALLIITGALLVALSPQRSPGSGAKGGSLSKQGLWAIVGAGLAYGTSPFFVKLGLASGGFPVAGTFVSYIAAAGLLGSLYPLESRRQSSSRYDRSAIFWFCISGLFVSLAQLLRYEALSLSPLSIIGPLFATSPIMLLLFSFLFNRKIETFNPRIILGAVFVVAGSVVLF